MAINNTLVTHIIGTKDAGGSKNIQQNAQSFENSINSSILNTDDKKIAAVPIAISFGAWLIANAGPLFAAACAFVGTAWYKLNEKDINRILFDIFSNKPQVEGLTPYQTTELRQSIAGNPKFKSAPIEAQQVLGASVMMAKQGKRAKRRARGGKRQENNPPKGKKQTSEEKEKQLKIQKLKEIINSLNARSGALTQEAKEITDKTSEINAKPNSIKSDQKRKLKRIQEEQDSINNMLNDRLFMLRHLAPPWLR